MWREWQTKDTIINESHDLNTSDIIKLFGKLAEHENKLK